MKFKMIASLAGLTVGLTACPINQNPPPPPPANGGIAGTVFINRAMPALAVKESRSFKADWQAEHVPGQILVVASEKQNGLVATNLRATLAARGLQAQEVMPGTLAVKTAVGNEENLATELTKAGLVVQPNYIYKPQAIPDDPRYPEQFYLPQINAPAAWDVNTNGALVAVLDSGADSNHPDLAGRLIMDKDFCPTIDLGDCAGEDNDPSDFISSGHGTHIAGIITANTNNGQGIAGLMHNSKVLVIKVMGPEPVFGGGAATSVSLAKGIKRAADLNAKVISISLGIPVEDVPGFDPDSLIKTAIQYADQKDVVTVVSSGNWVDTVTGPFNGPVLYPATDPAVLAVGSVNDQNQLSNFSGVGPELFMVAPGQFGNEITNNGLLSTKIGGGYEKRTGTSGSAPQVAAVAGLIRGLKPNLSVQEVKDILKSTAKDLGPAGRDNSFGFGLLDAGAALRKAAGEPEPQRIDYNIYAEYFKNGSFSRNHPESGHLFGSIPTTRPQFNFKINTTNFAKPLPIGTYQLSVCAKIGNAVEKCGQPQIVNYNGDPITGIQLAVNI